MKNALAYYYHLYPTKLIYHNHEYTFQIGDINYRLLPFTRSDEELIQIYQLLKEIGENYFSQIVPNLFQQPITLIQYKKYILLKEQRMNRTLTYQDIVQLQPFVLDIEKYKLLDRSHWVDLWSKKIDYFEYQKNYIQNKYPLLYNSLDYFIGLAENAISYVNEIETQTFSRQKKLSIVRKRVDMNMSFYDYVCPLHIVIDYKVRDMAEYLKSFFLHDYYQEEFLDQIFQYMNYNVWEYSLLMGRMLFPSFYFDCYEQIVNNILPEKNIVEILEKSNDYEYYLQNIYQRIKQKTNIARIDWLEKEKN